MLISTNSIQRCVYPLEAERKSAARLHHYHPPFQTEIPIFHSNVLAPIHICHVLMSRGPTSTHNLPSKSDTMSTQTYHFPMVFYIYDRLAQSALQSHHSDQPFFIFYLAITVIFIIAIRILSIADTHFEPSLLLSQSCDDHRPRWKKKNLLDPKNIERAYHTQFLARL